MAFTKRRETANSVGGFIDLFFHPQKRVYGIGAIWTILCIFTGISYYGLIFLGLIGLPLFPILIVASSYGALPEWSRYGKIGLFIGPMMVFIGHFISQTFYWGAHNTINALILNLFLSPVVIMGYVISIFSALCLGYSIRVNDNSILTRRRISILLILVSFIILLYPISYLALRELLVYAGISISGVSYNLSDFPMVLLDSVNGIILLVFLCILLIGAAVLSKYDVRKIGIITFIVGLILIILPFLRILPFDYLMYFNPVPFIALGGTWIVAPLPGTDYTPPIKVEDTSSSGSRSKHKWRKHKCPHCSLKALINYGSKGSDGTVICGRCSGKFTPSKENAA